MPGDLLHVGFHMWDAPDAVVDGDIVLVAPGIFLFLPHPFFSSILGRFYAGTGPDTVIHDGSFVTLRSASGINSTDITR
jgi:hypothetical protein